MGEIVAIDDDNVSFKDIGMDGTWDDEIHSILYEDITQISYGDNYSKMYYKYVTKKTLYSAVTEMLPQNISNKYQ